MKIPAAAVCFLLFPVAPLVSSEQANVRNLEEREPLYLENGTVRLGVDRQMGASIVHLSWSGYERNTVNIHDPGRLIQQSYYAGKSLDRISEGQHEAWSPWPWNPIQGGGVGSWARVTTMEKREDGSLYSETIPKLWDMRNEEADAVMRQWTSIEPGMPNAIRIRCELESRREKGDRWGPRGVRDQEIPALYFTRNFSVYRTYLGKGAWREETQAPGPPWGKTDPPLNVMACFNRQGQGIAVFSPGATWKWNFGPHGGGNSSEATDGPCSHLSPVVRVSPGPKSTLRYRYWIVVGDEKTIVSAVDQLLEEYSGESFELINP